MTNHVGRLYALAIAVLIFFVTWATVAAKPWVTTHAAARDPRLAALAAREQRIRHESVVVAQIVRHRWAVYRVALRKRHAQISAAKQAQVAAASSPAPSVQVVNLPPLTVTRTS